MFDIFSIDVRVMFDLFWSHDGTRRAPQTAIDCFGRNLGHIEGEMVIRGQKSGSPDGTFPIGKMTFLVLTL